MPALLTETNILYTDDTWMNGQTDGGTDRLLLVYPVLWTYNSNDFAMVKQFFFLLTHYQMTNFRLFQIERVCRQQFQI